VTKRPVPVSILREKDVLNYPFKALRELMMNAVMHRDYQANMPTRLYQYDHHIEIMNPGGLYGQARPENFPHVNDYRNSVVAGIMKTLSYVNMFNHGIGEVQDLLRQNDSPEAVFNVDYLTAFSVVVKDEVEANCSPTVHQLFTNLSPQACLELALSLPAQVKSLIISIKDSKSTAAELQLASGLSPKSKDYFKKQFLYPAIEAGMLAMTYPDNPRHPKQKYYLTKLGLEVLKQLNEYEK
jgi:ATP-dependent DNA helicase RecG